MSNLQPIVIYRALGGFVADCVPEERHDDSWVITEHPVEQGSTISDHVYKLPATLTLTYLWDFYSQNVSKSQSYLKDQYQKLLNIQAPDANGNVTPFSVFTGKRSYTNMLVASMSVATDRNTENMLSMRITCKEVILVGTSLVQLSNVANQKLTSGVTPRGDVPAVATNTAVNYLNGGS